MIEWMIQFRRSGHVAMGEDLDRFVEELKAQVSQEMKTAYGDGAFDRWMNPLHMGSMEDPDAHGCTASVCGDLMDIFLKVQAGRVIEAKFRTSGCGTSVVCGSFAAELAVGKTVDALPCIKGETILDRVGGLPAHERHCAYLAAEALQQACMDYMGRRAKRS
jgi:nitrogen fixation NifU-like protein